MSIFTIIGLVGIGMVLFTGLFALMISRLDAAVVQSKIDVDAAKNQFKPNTTLGFNISQEADKAVQFRDAREEAARQAVKVQRGANMRIGRKGAEKLQTTSENLKNDPVSAFKIAEVQGWKDMGEFAKAQTAAVGASAAPVAAAAGATKTVKRKLIPGKDYEAVAVTDNMSKVEKRAARIANGKAKYAAYKVLKESGQDMVVAAAAPVAAASAAPAGPSAAEAASAAGIEEPTYIEITDDMDKDAKKSAKISNIKARSAYKKALKAAGVSASAPPPAAAAPVAAAAPAVPAAEAAPAGLDDIPKPDLIEITDDMDKDAKKNAKISNIKAKSAYKKALKAAGIDPKSVSI